MTPGARAAAAVELLQAIESDHTQPADRLVSDWFRRRRYAGSGDRAAVSRLVYTVLRRRAQLDWWIERTGGVRDARARVIAALLIGEGWPAEQIAAAFDGGLYRPAALGDPESIMAGLLAGKGFDDPGQPVQVRANIPDWLEQPFRDALGDAMASELAALLAAAPVDLRVNTLKCTREEALDRLTAEGIEARPTPFSPVGLRLARRVNLAGGAAYRGGLIEIQDEASQIAALMVGARPGESVLDYCAGAGGKTLALAAAMENRGRLVACDSADWRLARAAPRLARAGVAIVETMLLGGDQPDQPSDQQPCPFDRVLVDAPCTGIGTWRRNPGEKWRLRPADLDRHRATQAAILDSAAALVAPGGRLVYAVCSLLDAEGAAQIESFLRRRGDFAVVPAGAVWAGTVGGVCPSDGIYLRLLPGRDGTDGFFLSVMERGKEK